MSFRDKLHAAQQRNRSWLCVGLDPDPLRRPALPELEGAAGLVAFCKAIIAATHDLACAFKPNLAFYLAHGADGLWALQEALAAIPPDIPVILDAKVGDIGNTQRLYGQAAFETLGVDGLTVSPYVGEDAVVPLLEGYPGRGLFILARTSNPDARRFQDYPGQPPHLYEEVTEAARRWAAAYPHSTVGLVVGATYEAELESLRKQAPELPFLIPGIGPQGGTLEAAVRFGAAAEGTGPLISASRAVIHASHGPDYADAARRAALQLREAINRLREASSGGQGVQDGD